MLQYTAKKSPLFLLYSHILIDKNNYPIKKLTSDATSVSRACLFYITFKMQQFLEIPAPILHDELVEKCKMGDNRSFTEI
jgi:hypothetical protein